MSFALAYMEDPRLFISNWVKCLNYGGWFAIADIDGLFSSHLANSDKYFNEIETFEKQSEKSKTYNFKIGNKIKRLMEGCGLEIIVDENDWYDRELNFKGKAEPDIVKTWTTRLERMVNLKSYFGINYAEFCNHFINTISKENHITNSGVKYYMGIKV